MRLLGYGQQAFIYPFTLWKKNSMRIFLPLILVTFSATTLPFSYPSQFGQDKYAHEHFFQNKRDGIFVDVGAHDGISCSNTYFFEKELGWSGICVEPIPEVFEHLAKNRSCLCVHACATAIKNPTVPFILGQGYTEMLSGMVHTFDPRHLARLKREIIQYGGSYKIIDIPTVNLQNLLDAHNIARIDFLSIDTEGSELEILQTIDFQRVHVSVIDVENNYNDNKIRLFLQSKGFHLVVTFNGMDEMYVNSIVK